MAVILPIAVWGLLWRAFIRRGQEWREAVITASLVWGVLLVALSECLSLLHMLSFPWVALAWGIVLLGLLAVHRLYLAVNRTASGHSQEPFSKLEWTLTALIIAIMIITGITALIAPPNTWDSMTYHMMRAAFWSQNASVDHYPTSNIRQLLFPPFAEYAILHTMLLSGGDHWANMIQWFSMVGSLIVASLLACDLGARREGQLYAAALCITLPMAILQASSTQNDYVVTFWLLCLTVLILRSAQHRLTWTRGVWIGLCLGLTLLTKATGYVFAVSLLGLLGLIALWQWRLRAWQILGLVGACALLLNGPFYIRNMQSFGSMLGSSQSQGESFNAEISLRVMVSNLLRNTAMHLMVAPNRLNETLHVQESIQRMIEDFHIGLQLSPSDPSTTFGTQTFMVPTWNTGEDTAGNPVHLMIFATALALFVLSTARWHRRSQIYLLIMFSHIAVFCMLLRWMSWISRFHLFLFAIMMVFAAVIVIRWRVYAYLALLIVLPLSLAALFNNETRTWIGERSIFILPRERQYFVAARQLGIEMREVADVMQAAGCREVGIGAGGDQWVYPLFVMLNETPPMRIEYLGFDDYPLGEFTPCGLIVYNTFSPSRYETLGTTRYVEQGMNSPFFDVYLQDDEESR